MAYKLLSIIIDNCFYVSETLITKNYDFINLNLFQVIENTHQIGDINQLKTIGNVGYNKTIPTLMAMIENRSTPLLKRIQAVDSLRKMPQSSFYDVSFSDFILVFILIV